MSLIFTIFKKAEYMLNSLFTQNCVKNLKAISSKMTELSPFISQKQSPLCYFRRFIDFYFFPNFHIDNDVLGSFFMLITKTNLKTCIHAPNVPKNQFDLFDHIWPLVTLTWPMTTKGLSIVMVLWSVGNTIHAGWLTVFAFKVAK